MGQCCFLLTLCFPLASPDLHWATNGPLVWKHRGLLLDSWFLCIVFQTLSLGAGSVATSLYWSTQSIPRCHPSPAPLHPKTSLKQLEWLGESV